MVTNEMKFSKRSRYGVLFKLSISAAARFRSTMHALATNCIGNINHEWNWELSKTLADERNEKNTTTTTSTNQLFICVNNYLLSNSFWKRTCSSKTARQDFCKYCKQINANSTIKINKDCIIHLHWTRFPISNAHLHIFFFIHSLVASMKSWFLSWCPLMRVKVALFKQSWH